MQRIIALRYRGIDISPLSIPEALDVVDDALEIMDLETSVVANGVAQVLNQAFGDGKRG